MHDRAVRWSLPKRLAFLIMAIFLCFSAAPILLTLLPWIGDTFPAAYQSAWNVVVVWLGEHVLGLPEPITILPNASADTTWNYVQMFGIVMISVIVGSTWAVVDRQRENYAELHQWLRVLVRYALSGAMLVYGLAKLLCLQFPQVSLTTLTQSYGEASPPGLARTFLGHSAAYSVFAGAAELLASLLLLSRRTTTLGALVSVGVLANVIAINFCFDVCVKLFSMTLMIMAIYLVADDLRRFSDAMIFNRPTAPAHLRPHFTSKAGSRVQIALKLGWLLLYPIAAWMYADIKLDHLNTPKPPLHGLYEVERFTSNGAVRPPLLGDPLRWRHFIVEAHGSAVVRTMDDKRETYAITTDTAARTFTLQPRTGDREQTSEYTYEQPTPDSLILHTIRGPTPVHVTLRKVDPSSFLLVSRGFHWVNEYPLNR